MVYLSSAEAETRLVSFTHVCSARSVGRTTLRRRVLTGSTRIAFLFWTSSRARGMMMPSRSYRNRCAMSTSLNYQYGESLA